MVIWPWIAGFLLLGYLTMGRSFAYLGIPPIFIGEIVLAAFLLLKPRIALGTWAASLLRPSPLNGLGLALLAFMAYGLWQVGRGVLGGYPRSPHAQVLHLQLLHAVLIHGDMDRAAHPDFLPKLIRVIAWVNGIYGVIYIVALRDVAAYIPGTDVPLFSAPAAQVVVILGLLCFERDLRAVWFVLLLNIVVTLVWQVRAEWAGLALGILAWGFLTGRIGRVIAIGMAGLAVLGMIELADIRLVGRNTEVSLSETVARAIAPIDKDLAQEIEPLRRLPRRHRGVAGDLVGCHLAVRAFPSDARGLRPRLWLPPDHRGAQGRAKRTTRTTARRTACSTMPSATRDGSGSSSTALCSSPSSGCSGARTGSAARLRGWSSGSWRWSGCRSRRASRRRSRRSPSTCCGA